MKAEPILKMHSLDQRDDVRNADERLRELEQSYRRAEKRLDRAWAELAALEDDAPSTGQSCHDRLSEARDTVEEAESALHAVAEALEEAREECRYIGACVWDEIDSVLRQERRAPLKEPIYTIRKAIDIDANRRTQHIEIRAKDVLRQGAGLSEYVLFDVAWDELSEEGLEAWLQFLERTQFLYLVAGIGGQHYT
jgi:hypothetical protein